MKVVKIRFQNGSVIMTIPKEFRKKGFQAGNEVQIELQEDGSLILHPTDTEVINE